MKVIEFDYVNKGFIVPSKVATVEMSDETVGDFSIWVTFSSTSPVRIRCKTRTQRDKLYTDIINAVKELEYHG